MQNAWNVQFIDNERLVQRVFEGDSPKGSGAVDFANELRRRGTSVDIISRRRGFAPPLKMKEPPNIGMLWCPYCVRWREFEEAAVKTSEWVTPVLLRCTVCTISIMDYYVRKYNPVFSERYFTSQEMRKRPAKEDAHATGRRRTRRR